MNPPIQTTAHRLSFLSFVLWLLYCLSIFEFRLLITSLVTSFFCMLFSDDKPILFVVLNSPVTSWNIAYYNYAFLLFKIFYTTKKNTVPKTNIRNCCYCMKCFGEDLIGIVNFVIINRLINCVNSCLYLVCRKAIS